MSTQPNLQCSLLTIEIRSQIDSNYWLIGLSMNILYLRFTEKVNARLVFCACGYVLCAERKRIKKIKRLNEREITRKSKSSVNGEREKAAK